jgi:4-aminobutyrate aminotransferase-like enzyme/Ser/Thr protein kinase RdoA (MazF antagonist)
MGPSPPLLTEFSPDQAQELLRVHWGLEGKLTSLTSYEDKNFALLDGAGEPRFVLRIQSAGDRERLRLEALILKQLARRLPGVAPELLPTSVGEGCVAIGGSHGRLHLARMMTWVPGPLLANLESRNLDTWFSLGELLGRVDRCLAELHVDASAGQHNWTMEASARLATLLQHEPDPRLRSLFEKALLMYGGRIQGVIEQLPQQLLFYDANEFNLTGVETPAGARVTGLFDLGDAAVSARVSEIGIAVAYAVQLAGDEPLPVALALVRGYHEAFPLGLDELELVLPCAVARLTMSLMYGRAAREADPDNPHLCQHTGDGALALERLLQIPPDQASQYLAIGLELLPKSRPKQPDTTEKLLAAREVLLNPGLSLSYDKPLTLLRGARSYLFDAADRAYLDCINNVCHVGHCHPRVVRAMSSQAALLNTNTRYLHPVRLAYAKRLADLFPDPLDTVHLVNSGSEATELALRMARSATGAKHLLVLAGGYHGNSAAAMGVSSYKFNAPRGSGAPDWVHELPCPDTYRGLHRGADAAHAYAAEVEQACCDIEAQGGRVAGLLAEPMIGCGGQIVPPRGWLSRAAEIVHNHGGLCLVDEVQVGFGRVGDAWWAFEREQFVPDLVTLGKPMGNGHPMGAVIATRAVAEAFGKGPEYFNTFGGNPVSCAVGMAVLDVIEEENLILQAAEVGAHLSEGLRNLAQEFPVMGIVRGRGLYLGVAFVRNAQTREGNPKRLAQVVSLAREAGVLLAIDGPGHDVLKIKPPLVFSRGDADLCLGVLRRALEETECA